MIAKEPVGSVRISGDWEWCRHRLYPIISGTLVAGQTIGEYQSIMTQSITTPRLSQDSLARILDVTQKLAQPYDLLHMLTEVVEAGESVLAADKAALWLYDATRNDLIMKVPAARP